MITVRFFAAVREVMERDGARYEAPGATVTANDVLAAIAGARLADLPRPLLVAINREHAHLTSPVKDGDEIAFFPPVSGG